MILVSGISKILTELNAESEPYVSDADSKQV